jgi:20S proteasome subunit beta 2
MTKSSVIEVPPKGGFSFDLCRRNAMLERQGAKLPKFRKRAPPSSG